MRLGTITRESAEYVRFIVSWLPGGIGVRGRYYYYRKRLMGIGRNVYISPGCKIRGEKNIVLGDGVGLGVNNQLYAGMRGGRERIEIGDYSITNSNVMINADMGGEIIIGRNVIIGPNVVIRASNHTFKRRDVLIRQQGHSPGRIIVGDDVWIAANAVILPNVVIGRGGVVAAGAVVTKDVNEYTVVGGVPAREIGRRGKDRR